MFTITNQRETYYMTGGRDDEMRKVAQRIIHQYNKTATSEYLDDDELVQLRSLCKRASWTLSQQPATVGLDFDSGLGIGGLGRHEEQPPQPSARVIEFHAQRQARARRCSKCGETEIEGAMFTTDPTRRHCDDCFA